MIPGNWKQQAPDGSIGLDGVHMAWFVGKDILLKPNQGFIVRVWMDRKYPTIQTLDSRIGNKGITFKCSVNDLQSREEIEHKDILDTPYEIAEFVKEVIDNYGSDDNNGDPDFETPPTENVPASTPVLTPALV